MYQLNIEKSINDAFNTLFIDGDSITLCIDNKEFEWLRCAKLEKGIAILIELNSIRTPFKKLADERIPLRRNSILKLEELTLKIKDESRVFLAVICRKKSLDRLFERLAADLVFQLFEISSFVKDPWDSLKNRIEGWQMLFDFYDNKREEKGLIGELIFYKSLLEFGNITPKNWTGPLGGTKDFMFSCVNFEVKTTSMRYGYHVQINGLFQVNKSKCFEKLVFIRLEESVNGSINLTKLIHEIQLKLMPNELIDFNKLLSEYEEDLFNAQNNYDLLELVVFDIDDNFPKISESSFIHNKIPTGVIRVSWTADLGNLEKNGINEIIQKVMI